jgi:uncharacterized protein YjbI with pentapeptide repeats
MKIALRLLLGVIAVGALGYLIIQGYSAPWTGFGNYTKPDEKFIPAKTLWDWLQLLIVPLFLAVGAWLIDGSRKRSERLLESDRQRQKTLEDYYACITDLLLRGQLKGAGASAEARSIARTRTLAALRLLDSGRKAQLLQFVYEAGLIDAGSAINLNGADFTGALLDEATLIRAELRGADFRSASLRNANLQYADLRGSDFSEAALTGAWLQKSRLVQARMINADLTDANLTGADVDQIDLSGATLQRVKGFAQQLP